MLWHVRALLEDRPGALACLAASGEEAVNVPALEVHPRRRPRRRRDRACTAGGWSAGRDEQLARRTGAVEVHVAPCSAHVLEDRPVRYMRAAERVMLNPLPLDEELHIQLDAGTGAHTLVLGDGDGDGLGAGAVVGCGTVARAEGSYEFALLVDDGCQGSGHGSRLLAGLVEVARERGASSLTCHVRAGNPAVPATPRRAGLRARAVQTDAVNTYVLAVDTTSAANPPGSQPRDGAAHRGATTGSANLPQEGAERRQVCPGADRLDEAVRSDA